MSFLRWLFGSDTKEQDELRQQITENFQPSMRVVGRGTLTMDPAEARKSARIYGERPQTDENHK